MTRKCVTDEEYGRLQRRLGEIARRVDEGTIPFKQTMNDLQKVIEGIMSTEMTIGGRTYEILGFLRGDEKSVVGHVMVDRSKEMDANLGEDDGQYLLDHQQDIPVALRGKVVFVFPDWRPPGGPGLASCVYWRGGEWVHRCSRLGDDYWLGDGRLLRRK